MAVTKEMVEAVSPFIVGSEGDFNEIVYETYKRWAEDELKIDDPGLPEGKYDEAWANLICDIFDSSRGLRNLKSEDTLHSHRPGLLESPCLLEVVIEVTANVRVFHTHRRRP